MGSWWGKPVDDTPDDVTGLTATQIQLIRDTWQVVYKNKRENCFTIFRILFTDHPSTRTLFRSMEDVDLDAPGEFEKNVAARAHMVRFMHSFATFMDTLDEPADLRQLLHDLGRTHAKHNVQPELFDALGPILMKALPKVLDGKFTPEVKTAWLAAYTFMSTHLKEGVEDGQRQLTDTK
ncbi:cytoglobin-2-like [Branchiostoma lanceolatum]|uniref:cytoglobin-2-like n=1 Tax=Branchiostoma lanceolatum TaxID=7740 RepID=UPI0034557878